MIEPIEIIIDLLAEFDEMGFVPTTTVPDPDAYAIKWREMLTEALIDLQKQTEPISCDHEKGGEWISVDERLPEPLARVVAFDSRGNMFTAVYINFATGKMLGVLRFVTQDTSLIGCPCPNLRR